ncbi:hypothetical protein B0T18DRAFT_143968 [Schizothecium vesticola]|uniref:Uncharacterized protein n=1 Tax=Schizothecium vesticola TaxID=314040 RepID=A0AA40K4Z4_9PEZI|nr:hypothetical protein B0T18DRAFT_143968 [Schizothecium vesticola]
MAWWDARERRHGVSASATDADGDALAAAVSAVGPVSFSTASSTLSSTLLCASVPHCCHCQPESTKKLVNKRRTALGDVSSRLAPEPVPRSTNTNTNMTMGLRQELSSPVLEELPPSPPTTPALIVHVDIRFTNPDIQPRYSRSYGSSPAFAPTARIRNGLLRRIDRCSRELLTRKDSAALDMINDASLERKPLRFEMTFRIITRDGGDWAQRTYRSYQKQPLTVADTKDIILASHRIVGLFLRKHDEGFLWMDGAVRDMDEHGSETTTDVSSPSLLCVPRSRFLEFSQSFEFVPGYTVEVSFRSRNSNREVPLFAKTVRVNSEQAAPLTVFASEDVLWRGLQVINQGLERRKQELDSHIRSCRSSHCQHSDDKSVFVELRVTNNLGPVYPHVQRTVESKLLLFRDPDSCDCEEFLRDIETTMADVRRDTDAKISGLDDFEFTILELRGSGWSTRRPATFNIGPSASFGRRTIQAALDRIQTGIADVLRGHNVAIHISSHKRGHLILDKAIVAHAKLGPKEPLSLPEEEEAVFLSRLKMQIQQDIDMVFEDTCTIDDIADEEVEQRPFSRLAALCANDDSSKMTISSRSNSVASEPERRPATPIRDWTKKPSPAQRPATPTTNSLKQREQEKRPAMPMRDSLKRRVQRVFSFTSRRSPRRDTSSIESVGSTNSHNPSEDAYEADSSIATSVAGDDVLEKASPLHSEERTSSITVSPFRRIHRKLSLLSRSRSARVSSASSTLGDEFPGGLGNIETGDAPRDGRREEAAEATARTTSRPSQAFGETTSQVAGDALISVTSVEADFDVGNARARMNPVTRPRITSPPGLVSNPKLRSGHSQRGILRPLMESPMDSPALAPFEDAQEFSSSVLDAEPLAIPKPAPPHSISQTASPAPEEYTTAPSTPGLSTGGDPSPRNSLLITPTYTRTLSGLRDCVVDIDTETNTTPMEVLTPNVGAMPLYQAPKDNLQLATTPLAGLVSAPEFVPATTLTAERPVEVSPTNTVTPKHGSKLSMSSLRASAPTFAPSFAPASLRAAAPTFVPSQGFVPVVEPAAPPQPAPQPAPAPTWAKVAAPAAPTWAKIAATEPKKAEVQPVAAKALKEVDSVADKEAPEPKLSEPEAEKEQDEVEGAHGVEAENSATPTATKEPQGEKADEGLPQNVVKEEDSAEVELKTPILESVDEDASPPAVSVHEEKLPEIEEDVVEQNSIADEWPMEEEQAVAVDITEGVKTQEDKKEEVVEEFVIEQSGVEQDNLPERSEEPEHVVSEEAAERPQPTEQISGLAHVFVWTSPSEDKIGETRIEQDDGEQESLPEEREDSSHTATEETVKRPEQLVERISGLTHVFVWASPSENKSAEEQVSGLKHVFLWADSDAQQPPLTAPARELQADKGLAAPEAEPAEKEPIPSEDDALDRTQTEAEQRPEIQTSRAAPKDKKAEAGPEVSAGPEDASTAIPELSSEQSGEESREKVEDVATSEPEVVEDQSAVQPETGTQVVETPTVEEQAAEKAAAVQDTNCEEDIQADSGSEPENLEPDVSEDESTQAPVSSVQDFAPSAPSDEVSPPRDTPAPPPTSANDSLTPTVTQLDTFNPTFLAPSPTLSVRSSVSSFAEWSTNKRPMADLSRDSVDTIRVSSDMPTHSEPESSHSCPPTAGYLGLGLGGPEMGLRGALGDSRCRLSLPLKNLFVGAAAGHKHGHEEADPKSQETTAVGTPESSVAGDDAGTPSKPKKRRLGEEGGDQKDGEVKYQEKEDAGLILAEEAMPSVLPRMMMLLAGVVAVGKALKKPSVY